MKVAICYSGMIRRFPENIDGHIEHLISKYDCDVYMSFWDVYGFGHLPFSRYKSDYHIRFDMENNVCEKIPIDYDDSIEEEVKNDIIKRLNPKECRFDSFKEFEPLLEKKEQILIDKYGYDEMSCSIGQLLTWNTISGYYLVTKCGDMVKNSGIDYDIVVKIRPTNILKNDIVLSIPRENTIYANSHSSWNEALNDTFLYGKPETMEKYHDIYNHIIDVLIKTGGPGNAAEHLLYTYLKDQGVIVNMDLHELMHNGPDYRLKPKK